MRVKESFSTQTYEMPEKIFVINMDTRKDRLEYFEKNYNLSDCKGKLTWHRIPAVVGKDVDWKNGFLTSAGMKDLEYTLKTGKRRDHSSLSLGAVGCYLSHLQIMKEVVKRNKPCIVCEDDIQFPSNFLEKTKEALQEVPHSSNAIIFFHIICDQWKLKCIPLNGNVSKVEQFWSMACYYITPEAAKTFLELGQPIEMQIDAAMSSLVQQGKLNLYAFPFVGTNPELGTDIQMHVE